MEAETHVFHGPVGARERAIPDLAAAEPEKIRYAPIIMYASATYGTMRVVVVV